LNCKNIGIKHNDAFLVFLVVFHKNPVILLDEEANHNNICPKNQVRNIGNTDLIWSSACIRINFFPKFFSQLVGWLRSANKAFWEINFRISGGARRRREREKQLAHAF
jgi:hypothetical protein